MTPFDKAILHAVAIGIAATAVMELWLLLLQSLNVPTLNLALLGRQHRIVAHQNACPEPPGVATRHDGAGRGAGLYPRIIRPDSVRADVAGGFRHCCFPRGRPGGQLSKPLNRRLADRMAGGISSGVTGGSGHPPDRAGTG